ncbi:uncharacterized protein ACN2A1_003393 isoform 2-T2 [Glossina fuscipes fuscipes]
MWNNNKIGKSLIAADEHGLKGHRSLFGILYHIVAPLRSFLQFITRFCTNYNLNIFLSDQRPARDLKVGTCLLVIYITMCEMCKIVCMLGIFLCQQTDDTLIHCWLLMMNPNKPGIRL